MSHFNTAISGLYEITLPQWGRCFWQSPTDGELFLAFASGTSEVFYTTSSDSGINWTAPVLLFPVDDFSVHNNFDIFMDPRDHIHCAFRYNDSGCYKFMGKSVGGGWTDASGVGIVGFCDVSDSGTIKGFQGSITVTERDFGGDVSATFPLLRIAAKDSSDDVDVYYMGYPHDSGYLLKDTVGGPNAGTNGGFPIIFNDSESDAPGLSYYNDAEAKIECYNRSFGWIESSEGSIYLQSGDIYPNSQLAFGSGVKQYTDGMMFVTSSSGHDIYGNTIDAFVSVWKSLEVLEESGVWPWQSGIPRSGVYGIDAGTRCDFSFDDNGSTHLYYLAQDEVGHYSINRVLQTTIYDGSVNFEYNYYYSNEHPSGVKSIITAGLSTAGGTTNRVAWENFKAARHPLSPGNTKNGIAKGQFLATLGHTPTQPSGSILTVWNLENAPGTKRFQQPYFRMDYTATSGSGPFVGIDEVFFSSNSNNMFDQNPTSYGLFANGSYIYLEFDRVVEIDKIDVQGTRTEDIGQIDVYASFDNSTFRHVGTIPSGNPSFNYLRRLTSDPEALTDESFDLSYKWDPIAAQYIYMQWTTTYGSSGRRIGEIRIFGPAATSGGLYTYGQTYRHDGPVQSPFTEEFRHHEGTLPPGWRTSGDYNWGIVASGDFTRTTSLPSASNPPGYDGLIPSGRFEGVTRGSGDGFSVRNTPNTPHGTSGILEVDIEVTSEENLAGGKTISFDYQLDMHPDDVFRVELDNGNTIIEVTGIRREWTNESYTITAGQGDYTVRWIYTRGNSDIAGSIGAAWIDNFVGMVGPVINSVHGFVKAEFAAETGSIFGYLNTNYSEAIHGYVSGAPLTSEIHGYLSSAVSPDVTSSVYGWLKGNGTWINGYVLASSGEDITTYPTGAIHGYVKVLDSGALSSINGYVDGRNDQVINGYLIGGSDVAETGAIHGYVAGNNANSYIYGLVNGSGENYTTTSIHGYVDSRYGIGDQVIHGYVSVASGGLNSINGYLLGWDGLGPFSHGPQSMIHGYLVGPPSGTSIHGYVRAIMPYSSIHGYLGSEALVASGGGLVGATSTSNVVAGTNFIHGYIKGHDGSQFIHGYVLGPLGGTSSIHGYVLAGVEDNQINGYVVGVELPTSSIHGFTSGVNWEESEIYGWLQGVSGIENSSILGYAVGAEEISSTINAKLIGTVARDNSQAACLSHNFTLPALPTVTGIPTVFMNTGV